MKTHNHIRLLIIVTVAWILFWIAGLPDYYQQYSARFMMLFDLAILPPICFVVYRSIKKIKPWKKTQGILMVGILYFNSVIHL